MTVVGFLLGIVVISLLVLAVQPRRKMPPIDSDLEAAEKEVRELDASITPEEAEEEFDDWGPGAPKPG